MKKEKVDVHEKFFTAAFICIIILLAIVGVIKLTIIYYR
jgi:hypothetical protein